LRGGGPSALPIVIDFENRSNFQYLQAEADGRDRAVSSWTSTTPRGRHTLGPPSPVERYPLTESCALVVQRGNLARVSTDAVVNAANPRMLGGGGVDGAIHRAAGPRLLEACREVPEIRPGVRCPTGEARLTAGFGLPARYVIHTVGPVYRSPELSAPLLRAAYAASLALADEHGLARIAFPAISCGAFGYPLAEAASVALAACREHAGRLGEIRFVLFDEVTRRVWSASAKEMS